MQTQFKLLRYPFLSSTPPLHDLQKQSLTPRVTKGTPGHGGVPSSPAGPGAQHAPPDQSKDEYQQRRAGSEPTFASHTVSDREQRGNTRSMSPPHLRPWKPHEAQGRAPHTGKGGQRVRQSDATPGPQTERP